MDAQPIKIAILAMGGEGGGVLADWIVHLAEANGHIAQATSVPGVAQRTGATIYYVELFPEAAAQGRRPVLALMPMPGDVDVVLASELMEAGRAVQRGLVTPERTALIASTHRVYAIAEKIVPGDGRVDSGELLAHARLAAQRFIGFDMAALAEQCGSVVSAVLFGALAGAGVLPFGRAAFVATIEHGGVGVKASVQAFEQAFEQADRQARGAAAPAADDTVASAAALATGAAALPRTAAHAQVQALLTRIHTHFPECTRALLIEGVRRLIDHQDPAYAGEYLDRVERFLPFDPTPERPLLLALARHLALWMAYEDTARVAQLKTRGERFDRVRAELQAAPDAVVHIDDYLHPRFEEVCESLPLGLARWLQGSVGPRRWVERAADRGIVLHTASLRGFVLLWLVARLRRWRRGSLRHALETARIDAWLAGAERAARHDVALAVEVLQCQQLVKGYGDTHARGLRKFDAVMAALQRAGTLPAAAVKSLCDAALADEQGTALQAALDRLPGAR